MRLKLTVEVDIAELEFPDHLPIPEIEEAFARKRRALDALKRSSQFPAVMTYLVLENRQFIEELYKTLPVPLPSLLKQAADETGDSDLSDFVARRGEHTSPSSGPTHLLEAAFSRFRIGAMTISESIERPGVDSATTQPPSD